MPDAAPTPGSEPGPSVVGDIDFPPTSGQVTGWVIVAAAVVGSVLVVRDLEAAAAVRWVLALLLIGVLGYAFMLRPRVRIRDDALVMVNPFSTITAPLERVRSVSVRSLTKVSVRGEQGDKTYAAVAVGRALREMARPTGEGYVPAPGGEWLGRVAGSFRVHTPAERVHPGSAETADLLEDTVARGILQVRAARADTEPRPVTTSYPVPLVAVAGLLALATLLAFLLG